MEQKAKSVSPFSNESRNAYVLEHLTDALLSLLAEKPMNEISISELCNVAGVGRTSFYRNFESKEEILKGHIRRLFQDWVNVWETNPGLSLDKAVYQVFSHFETNRGFYGLLNERGLVYLLKDIILDLCGFDPEQEVAAAYSSAYMDGLKFGFGGG